MRVYLLIPFPCSKLFFKHWYNRQEVTIAGMYTTCAVTGFAVFSFADVKLIPLGL